MWNDSGERWRKEKSSFTASSKVLCAPCILLYRHRMAAKAAQSPRWGEGGKAGTSLGDIEPNFA